MSAEPARTARAALEGEYEFIRELGIGGTAVVYLARKRSTGEEVAIKLIRATFLEDEEALARFAREARYASRIDHPNVVPIREVMPLGSGRIALIMAHVPGRTLKQLVRDEGRLPVERAERILRDVAAGLNAAHALGIVHRDVKPENIFIDESGDALLADFGLARSTTTADTQLTMTGVAVGTPTYMPPEQIDGAVIDVRGDVYSLGLVCWEMLTGKRPWDGDSLYALLYHQKHDYLPDVREFRDDIPDRLANVIGTAIEKEPEARWQSISEMIAALDGEIPARPPARAAASDETVRFERGTVGKTPSGRLLAAAEGPGHLAVLSSIATELDAPAAPQRRSRLPLASIASLLAIIAIVGSIYWFTSVRVDDSQRGLKPLPTNVVAADTAVPQLTPNGSTADSTASALAAKRSADSAATLARLESLPAAANSAARANSVVSAGSSAVDARQPQPLAPVSPNRGKASGNSAAATSSTPAASPPSAAAPAPAATTPPARALVVAGGMHSCLIGGDGRAYCWGANTRGQLGTSSNARAAVPTPIGGNLDVTQLAAGLSHSCALVQGGIAWCWGENDHGQLGDRSTATRTAPVRVAEARSFRSITAGASHTCALDNDGAAWCWGAGSRGQLGNGATSDASAPVAVSNVRFARLTAGWNFTCGLDLAGHAYCWGENTAGQLGIGDSVDRSLPALVSGDLVFTSIAAGASHACAVTLQGDVYCWGRNSSGQLGDGTTTNHPTPVAVKADARFASVTAGAMHSCAIDSGGQAYCWGLDSYGQLGDGGNRNALQPVPVVGGHRFATVRAFGSHTCGTTVTGDAFCWGYNLEGQLGDGTRTNRSRPVYLEPPNGK